MKLNIPKEFLNIAYVYAKKRSSANEQIREGNIKYEAKDPFFNDYIGIVGELLATLEASKKGNSFFFNEIYKERPIKGPDIIVYFKGKEYKIDVKASVKNHIRVPVHKIEKSEKHNIFYYWFFVLDLKNETYRHEFFSSEEVKTWPIVEMYGHKSHLKKL